MQPILVKDTKKTEFFLAVVKLAVSNSGAGGGEVLWSRCCVLLYSQFFLREKVRIVRVSASQETLVTITLGIQVLPVYLPRISYCCRCYLLLFPSADVSVCCYGCCTAVTAACCLLLLLLLLVELLSVCNC
ncbi:uncharacterized protein [Spinacia oleracea]|uniref:Uncharacterized protein isoform X1 n=1 Tax=Spinacia oleracea TaxID=3562 RepID=A0ABM3RAW2_SPIOL|nr:uncharacterized protein LOC110794151 isoform X1 [Spinacia oleracea]